MTAEGLAETHHGHPAAHEGDLALLQGAQLLGGQGARPLEPREHRPRRREALLWIPLDQALDQGSEAARPAVRDRVVAGVARDLGAAIGGEQADAQGVQVRPPVEGLALQQFGCHVERGPARDPLAAPSAGQAEVQDLAAGAALLLEHQQIVGLEIQVEQVAGMAVFEGAADVGAETEEDVRRGSGGKTVPGLAPDPFARVVRRARVGVGSVLVHAGHAAVPEPCPNAEVVGEGPSLLVAGGAEQLQHQDPSGTETILDPEELAPLTAVHHLDHRVPIVDHSHACSPRRGAILPGRAHL